MNAVENLHLLSFRSNTLRIKIFCANFLLTEILQKSTNTKPDVNNTNIKEQCSQQYFLWNLHR